MNAHRACVCALMMMLAAIIGGCLSPGGQDFGPSSARLARAAGADATAQPWAAIQATLRRNHLTLDRVDERAGIITTLPVGSKHFFEFWRHDVDTRRDFWEATLNPMRRWVEVHLTPGELEGSRVLQVIVHKERLSSPDRQYNSSASAYQFFGYRLPATSGEAQITPADDRWLDQGRDPATEARLLREILATAGGSDIETDSANGK